MSEYIMMMSLHGNSYHITALIARLMGPTWGPSGADRTQVGPHIGPTKFVIWVAFCEENQLITCTWIYLNKGPVLWSCCVFFVSIDKLLKKKLLVVWDAIVLISPHCNISFCLVKMLYYFVLRNVRYGRCKQCEIWKYDIIYSPIAWEIIAGCHIIFEMCQITQIIAVCSKACSSEQQRNQIWRLLALSVQSPLIMESLHKGPAKGEVFLCQGIIICLTNCGTDQKSPSDHDFLIAGLCGHGWLHTASGHHGSWMDRLCDQILRGISKTHVRS